MKLWNKKGKQEKKVIREVFFDEYIPTPEEKYETKKEKSKQIIIESK
jgi:hypothetical protein